jgi:chromosome segregation ATPase
MSLQNEIIDYLKNFPEGVKVASIRVAIKHPPQNITSTLWKMKKLGKVSHNKDTHLYKLLTDVNKPQAPKHSEVVKEGMAKTISKLNAEIVDYKKTLDRADEVYENLALRYKALESTHTQLKEKYDDALAIVRYLENKLYLVIKSNRANANT